MEEFRRRSRIVLTENEVETIKTFFAPKRIDFVQMLYRASENGFSANRFHAKCDHIPSTLTVCWTEFDKKIGGYNPSPWCSDATYKSDPTSETFTFSLTNEDKFVMNQSLNATYDDASYGPTFGDGYDL